MQTHKSSIIYKRRKIKCPVYSNFLNNRTPILVNDIDLKLIKKSTAYYPWKLDPDNPYNSVKNYTENNVDNVK